MFWGIDRPEWVQLWSGTVGAFLAALIGGLVALAVVRLTNRSQARLAAEAREKAAIADLVAGSDRFLTEYRAGFTSIEPLAHLVEAAGVRWRMELSHEGMKAEIFRWPAILRNRARRAYEASSEGNSNTVEYEALLDAVAELRFAVMDWPSIDDKERDRMVRKLSRYADG